MNPERLIGSLIMGGLGRRMPSRTKAAVGMGLLGVAIAAIEHFSQQGRSTGAAPPPPPGGGPPPPPPGVPDVPITSPPAHPIAREREAILLVQAMAAAAWADGVLDVDERERILSRARTDGLAADELELVARTLKHPPTMSTIVAQAVTPELAEQVYGASLLAISVDSTAEHTYLAGLAARLSLSPEAVARIHRLLGAPEPS